MKELSQNMLRNIEINSCGPFVHANYQIDGVTWSQEGPLTGRAEFLANSALSALQNLELDSRVRILDVGSYDGWILNQLYIHGKFRNLIGLEPRRSNIQRGQYLRKLLKIEDSATHLC
jgi:hypothetical protein